jgi:hypothetical protein
MTGDGTVYKIRVYILAVVNPWSLRWRPHFLSQRRGGEGTGASSITLAGHCIL